MSLKVAKKKKGNIFSVFSEISSTKQIKHAFLPLYYENMTIYL